MSQNNDTTKRKAFKHLTKEERAQIEILLRQGIPKTEIARAVGISRSTLYNELNRGIVDQLDSELHHCRRYFWDAGQRVYEEHRRNSRPCLKFAKAFDFLQYAEDLYSSYQRGTNEKQNSLIRRFIPKGQSFDNISDETITAIKNWINHLPRKIFNDRSADDLFQYVLFDIAI